MATILKAIQREFKEELGKVEPFRLFSDISRTRQGIFPQYLNFDIRQLHPGQYSAPYHFHRFAEELFMIISGVATIRTSAGLEIVSNGDLIFFETGETGAHQLYNHTTEICTYLDVRTFIGHDICEYPDSHKLLIAPSFEVFDINAQVNYFDGETNIQAKGQQNEQP